MTSADKQPDRQLLLLGETTAKGEKCPWDAVYYINQSYNADDATPSVVHLNATSSTSGQTHSDFVAATADDSPDVEETNRLLLHCHPVRIYSGTTSTAGDTNNRHTTFQTTGVTPLPICYSTPASVTPRSDSKPDRSPRRKHGTTSQTDSGRIPEPSLRDMNPTALNKQWTTSQYYNERSRSKGDSNHQRHASIRPRSSYKAKQCLRTVVLITSSLLCMTSFASLRTVQSVLNPRRTFGVMSLAVFYAAAVASTFVAPTIVSGLTARATLVVGYLAHVAYAAAGFYLPGTLLVPGALVAGATTGPLWSVQSRLTIAGGRQQTNLRGFMNGLMYTSSVCGNLIIAFVLVADNETVQLFEPGSVFANNATTKKVRRDAACERNTFVNSSIASERPRNVFLPTTRPRLVPSRCSPYKCCGALANDEDAEKSDDVIRVPHHSSVLPYSARTWLVGFQTGLVAVATLLALCSEPPDASRFSGNTCRHATARLNSARHAGSERHRLNRKCDKSRCSSTVTVLSATAQTMAPCNSSRHLLLSASKILKDPHVQLMAPLVFFSGFSQGFILTDFTKAYVNCAIGIHQVGFVMAIYSTMSALSAIAIRLATVGHRDGGGGVDQSEFGRGHIKRTHVAAAGAMFNAGLLLVLARWRPSHDDRAMFYVVASCLGLCEAVWNTQTDTMFRLLFADDHQFDATASVHRTLQSLGLMVSLICSTSPGRLATSVSNANLTAELLPPPPSSRDVVVLTSSSWPPSVATKIYIQCVLFVASLVLYAAVEYTLPRRSQIRVVSSLLTGGSRFGLAACDVTYDVNGSLGDRQRQLSISDVDLVLTGRRVRRNTIQTALTSGVTDARYTFAV